MKDSAVVSFSNKNGRYYMGMERLSKSLQRFFTGDFIGFKDEEKNGFPLHSENPYAFKVFAIEKVKEMGCRYVLWLDSSVFAIKDISPVFDLIKENGFVFQFAGHYVGTWSNDFTLNYFGITRQEAMKMPMIGNAGLLGFDFQNPKGIELFEKWKLSMEAGCFKGSWKNHRHDMTCSSIIVNQMGIIDYAIQGDQVLEYQHGNAPAKDESILFKASGM